MLTFLFKNLLIFTQNFSLSNVEKKNFLSSLFLKKIYQFFKIWKKFMHKNAIKIVGGVKFSKKYLKIWDFLSKNCGIFSSKEGQKSGIFDDEGGIFAIQDLATLKKSFQKYRSRWRITIICLSFFLELWMDCSWR